MVDQPNLLDDLDAVKDIVGFAFGVCIHDEPRGNQMDEVARISNIARERYPDLRLFTDALGSGWTSDVLWGDTSRPGHSYENYLDDLFTKLRLDLVLYDVYPFLSDGSTKPDTFDTISRFRAKALAHHLPYGTYLQAIDIPAWPQRRPSETDLRMQAYAHLAAGYTALSYFPYGISVTGGGGVIDENGTPGPLYPLCSC